MEITANIRKDGTYYIIDIPELDGVTQARNRKEVPVMAADYVVCTAYPRTDVTANARWAGKNVVVVAISWPEGTPAFKLRSRTK